MMHEKNMTTYRYKTTNTEWFLFKIYLGKNIIKHNKILNMDKKAKFLFSFIFLYFM